MSDRKLSPDCIFIIKLNLSFEDFRDAEGPRKSTGSSPNANEWKGQVLSCGAFLCVTHIAHAEFRRQNFALREPSDRIPEIIGLN